MERVATFAAARRLGEGRVVLVPTMGFLHEGHLSLLTRGREMADTLMMSLFVNPLQFEDPADLARYPRDPGRDVDLAAAAGVDVLFAPEPAEMYPVTPVTRVRVGRLGDRLEGVHRPGHFEGVATVVAKLFAGLRPNVAVFGRKDAQQLAVVRRMTTDLSFPLEIVGARTIREPDGLALSSRNLFVDDRDAALGLSRGLFEAVAAVEAGLRDAGEIATVVRAATGGMDLDYAELVSADDMTPLQALDRTAVLAAAGRVGSVRLIDNVVFEVERGRVTADTGVRLDRPSVLYERTAGRCCS